MAVKIQPAREYSDLSIIMAHCGQIIFSNEAAAVFNECPNVFGDTSWSPGFLLRKWTRNFGPRLMPGSDHADNMGTEIAKVETTGFNEDEQVSIFHGTAVEVFKLTDTGTF